MCNRYAGNQLPLWYKIRSDQLNLLGRLSGCGQPVQWSMVVVELLQIHAAEHHSDTGLIAIYNKSLEQ